MKSYRQILTEVFDAVYPFEIHFDNMPDSIGYTFQTDDETRVEVTFTQSHVMYEVDFKSSKGAGYSLTGGGDEFKIFSTVIAIMKDFIKRYGEGAWESIIFHASKHNFKGNTAKPTNRARLYERMLNKLLPHDWTYSVFDTGENISFEIEKPK